MKELAYCGKCRDEVEFETVSSDDSIYLDGVAYSFVRKDAKCKKCGSIATYQPYVEEMGKAFDDAVRKSNDLVSLETILDIPKRYRIGKRPLSKLLGWGEHTYSRFMDGAIPSKAYSDKIKEIDENPLAYIKLLKDNKDRISDVAYNKSLSAVEEVVKGDYPEFPRLLNIADYFRYRANCDITVLSVNKLIYYAQSFSKHFLGYFLTRQSPKAWAFGPVYGQVWHVLNHSMENDDERRCFLNNYNSPFNDDEEEFLNDIYMSFRSYSGEVLSNMTHNEDPWVKARKRAGAEDGDSCTERIKLTDMESYFEYQIVNLKIEKSSDIHKYAEMQFAKTNNRDEGC